MSLPRVIAAPVTLAADSPRIVATAAELAETVDAELVLVGIAPLAAPIRPAAQTGDPTWLADDNQQRFADLLVRERLDELSGELPAGLRVQTLLTWEPAGPALLDAAQEALAELIVIPMRRGSTLGHALHDLADRHVLHHSDVPVLVVPT